MKIVLIKKLTVVNQIIKLITANKPPQIEHFYLNYKRTSVYIVFSEKNNIIFCVFYN